MRPSEDFLHRTIDEHADRLDAHSRGELTAGEFRPIRLSYGLYYQLDHTSHLQRIKIPGGSMSAEQLERITELADRFGRSLLHITTRQDVQFHWVPLEAAREIYHALQNVGISTRGACSDSVRNVTASPCAGNCRQEAFDVLPYALALDDYFLFHPLNLTLPRKFKPAFSGCPEDEAQGVINDLAFYARREEGREGFSVLAGGGLGPAPHLAKPLYDFIPAEDVLVVAEAVVRVQHRYGERKNRHKARMKFLLQRMGLQRFREAVAKELERVAADRGEELRQELRRRVEAYREPLPVRTSGSALESHGSPAYARWLGTNVREQRQVGYHSVTVNLPLGDLTADQARALADASRQFGNAMLRATNDQNLVLPFVSGEDVPEVYRILTRLELAEGDALHLSDVTSCPGADYCSLAVTRSMSVARRIREHFEAARDLVQDLGRFRIKISGCPNSCGQHHIGDIGLTGMMVKDAHGQEQPHCSILLGGSVGETSGAVGKRLSRRYAEENVPEVIERITQFYRTRRTGDESFGTFVRRVGIDTLEQVADSEPAAARLAG